MLSFTSFDDGAVQSAKVNAACNATSVPELEGLYAQAQQEVLVNSSLELVESPGRTCLVCQDDEMR